MTWSAILGEAPVKSPCKRPPKPHKSPTAQELEEIRQICREHDEYMEKYHTYFKKGQKTL